MEFEVGSEVNVEIEAMLGTGRPAPDYCEDASLCIRTLEDLGVVLFVVPTEKPKKVKRFVQEYLGVFCLPETGVHVTMPFEKASHAAACALLFALQNK